MNSAKKKVEAMERRSAAAEDRYRERAAALTFGLDGRLHLLAKD
ncbi:MAG: hypothetical protein WAN65_01625 [Candidatus Sulfotelmatobacter sp.]